MDLYGIGSIFRQVAEKGGLVAALAVLAALIIAGAVAWVAKTGVAIAREWVAAKQREIEALVAELQGSRRQVHEFLTNHLAHLAQEREEHRVDMERHHAAMTALQVSQSALQMTQAELLDQLKRHRDAVDLNFKSMDAQHDDMARSLSRIEGSQR